MNQYRKKPVIIEAVQLSPENLDDVVSWCGGSLRGTQLPRADQEIDIVTLEGTMRARVGDWVVRGVRGEFYPVDPGIFNDTYEAV